MTMDLAPDAIEADAPRGADGSAPALGSAGEDAPTGRLLRVFRLSASS